MKLFPILLVICMIQTACNRKTAVYSDCIENESKEYLICVSAKDLKSKSVKIHENESKDIVYERELSNGGNAEWHSSSVAKITVFTGYNDEVSVFYFDVINQRIVDIGEDI